MYPSVHLPILPAFREALIEIRTDDALIQFRSTDVFHTVQGVLMRVVFDEAEAARCLLESVEAHDETLNLTTPEEMVSMCVKS